MTKNDTKSTTMFSDFVTSSEVPFDSGGEMNKSLDHKITLTAFENVTNGNSVFVYDYLDIDYSSTEYIGEIKTVPCWEMIVKISVYAVIMATAIVGNILIIAVVIRNKRMQTTTNFYIVNLAVSDLLVTGFCTWVHLVDNLTEGWILGTFFCKFNSFAQVLSLVSSIFSLTLIACDRFFGIVFAMKAHILERKARYSIILLWICSLAIAAPLLLVRTVQSVQWKDHKEIWCDDIWAMVSDGTPEYIFSARRAYYTVLTVALYFLPMLVMSAIYLVIILTVWFARSPGERVSKEVKVQGRLKRKVILMLVLILATFGICWLPLQIKILYTEFRTSQTALQDWYFNLEFFAYTMAFSNSALNPIIYAGFNENFRNVFLRQVFVRYSVAMKGSYMPPSPALTPCTALPQSPRSEQRGHTPTTAMTSEFPEYCTPLPTSHNRSQRPSRLDLPVHHFVADPPEIRRSTQQTRF